MACMLSRSQRYYVPRRMHEMHRPRSFGKRPKKDDPKNEYARAFASEQDKVLLGVFPQARTSFATRCAKLSEGQKFFSSERTMESRMDGVDLRIHRRDGLRRGLRLPFAAWHAVFLNSG
ncbi:hypothetical protein P692DRAFT_20823449 [Suillus brevipes Sb2]|nr:hypothetical protein P692DRAFT_20823449 [Suillus brevipes Sb2]